MKYFIVFQNKTYREEKEGQYLWAPQKTSQGHSIFHWDNMKKVQPGDFIFSMFRQQLVSVNIATSNATRASNPFTDSKALWEEDGWLVKADYNELEKPIIIKDYIEEILNYCPTKYSPFTRSGGGAQGYLFEIDQSFGTYLLNLIYEANEAVTAEDSELNKEVRDKEALLQRTLDNTEVARLVKTRIGQYLFKRKLLTRTSKCEVCGINIISLLRGSHCKPWRRSDNYERLDINNGLLLCPNHDSLFDKGLISFDEKGFMIISKEVDSKLYNLLNIDSRMSINITDDQLPYLEWHRNNVLQ